MTIIRINNFVALPGKDKELADAFKSILPKIRSSQGCASCELLQNAEQPDRIVIVEEWDSISSHQAAAKNVDPEDFQKVMSLLQEKPTGKYYTEAK